MKRFAHFFVRWLKRLVYLILGLLGVTLAAALFLFFFPGSLIQPRTLPLVEGVFETLDLPVEWESGTWSARSVSLLTKELTLSLEKPCYRQADPFTLVCLERLDARISFNLLRRKFHIARLEIPSGKVQMEIKQTMGPEPLPEASATPTPLRAIRAMRKAVLSKVTWDKIHIGNIAVSVVMPSSSVRGALSADATSSDGRRDLDVRANGTLIQKGKAKQKLIASLKLGVPRRKPLEYEIVARTAGSKPWLEVSTHGTAASDKLEGSLKALLRAPIQGVHEAGVKSCHYTWLEAEANLSVQCEVGIRPSTSPWTPISIALNGTLDLSDPANREALKVDAKTKVANFQRLVRAMKATGWAIPAPFNQLGGEFSFNATLVSGPSFEEPRIAFDVDSALDSKNQHLHFDGNGKLTTDATRRATTFEAEVAFTNTRLILPNVSPTEMPRLVPDSSIVLSSKEMNRKPSTDDSVFHYKIAIRAPKEQPVRLYSPQLRQDVPISIDLVAADTGVSGTVRVEPFPVELFRRKAQVKKINLDFDPNGATELSGRIDISYASYDLKLAAYGTLEEPKFSITSNPPLSESSALSLLLFGRPLEELSTGEDESLGNAKAALANGAVSAMSMYLLASTPIESIGYDPTRGQFQATIRLMEGTSLQVSSSAQGPTGVGIRKRLGRNWVFNTFVERAPLSQDKSVSTLLEWSKVY